MRPPLASQASVKYYLSADPCQRSRPTDDTSRLPGGTWREWARSCGPGHFLLSCMSAVLGSWPNPWRRPPQPTCWSICHHLTNTCLHTHVHTHAPQPAGSRTHRSASTRVNTGLCTTPHSAYALTSACRPICLHTLICVHTPTLVHAA